jgi:hypothetical protein
MKRNQKQLDKAEIMFLDKMLPKFGELGKRVMSFVAHPYKHSMCAAKYGKRAQAKDIYWCSECGAEFPLSEVKDFRRNPDIPAESKYYHYWYKYLGTCPHCGRQMKIEKGGAYKHQRFEDIIAVNATMGEWKITRYFVRHDYGVPGKPAQVNIEDIGASWTKGGNTYHYIARLGGMYYSKFWRSYTRHFAQDGIGSDTECKTTERYRIPASFSLSAELTKRGIDPDKTHGLKLDWILDTMAEYPAFETLWKAGEWKLATFFKRRINEYWAQIKIVRRHGYEIADLREWRDMVDMLHCLDMDTHNPKFLCPDNLHDAHNALVAERQRRRRIEEERWRRQQDEWARERARQAMLTRKETNEDFIKRRGKYFGISIPSTAGFTIVALQSVDDFEREGNTLHHCVYACGYYKKEGSLILSARDADNNPIETLEIDLRSYKILQCYGPHDSFTPLHKEIVKTMTDNMWQVKAAAKGGAAQVA